jgi:hypothetical protein
VVKLKRVKWARHVARRGNKSRIFVRKTQGKKSRGRLGADGRRKIMFPRETGCEGMNWIHLVRAMLY